MTATARRIRLDLAYDGTDFAGWQFQPRQRTAQGVLEQTLRELQGGRSVNVRGAGRTDSGVHANQQVADCEIQTGLDEILLDDSRRLAQRAGNVGVDVTLDLAEGMWHVYQAFAGMMPEADEALIRAAVFLRTNARAVVDTDALSGV